LVELVPRRDGDLQAGKAFPPVGESENTDLRSEWFEAALEEMRHGSAVASLLL
jgi:hypothetical protein